MGKQILKLFARWLANGLGLWLTSVLGIVTINGGTKSFVIAGLILAVLNAVVKPILIIFTLPIIALSLGFFLIVINAIVLYILSLFYGNIVLEGFLLTMLAGIVIGLVNYIVTFIFERFIENE